MKPRVIAIGLDATDPLVLEQWIDEGRLPNLARFRARGAFGWLENVRYYRTETSWITFLTGALPSQTGEWGHVAYDPRRYVAQERSAYGFVRYPPFYALLRGRRVAVFDAPLAQPVDGVDGVQVMGWGTEVNQCLRASRPPELMSELIARHGPHPMFEAAEPLRAPAGAGADDDVYSYRIPSSYDLQRMDELRERLCLGARRRAALMRDLLAREDWDLFLGVFSETHTAGHLLWHLGREHPLRAPLTGGGGVDPMRDVFEAVDEALGVVLAAAPAGVQVVLFSIYGIGANVLDLPSMAFLPELLYRWNFPGSAALGASGAASGPPPPMRLDYPAHWKDEVWRLRARGADSRLESPSQQDAQADPLAWQPCNWYRPLWPSMRAFALPTYSEGLIRINLQGRDASGLVAPHAYHRTCDEICELLGELRDARSGGPMVREIVRTRSGPGDDDPSRPPADLIVLWQEDTPTDVVEGPRTGRIGPLPYFRSGGHCSRGFLAAAGPGIVPGSRVAGSSAQDLTATILHLLGEPVPAHVGGRPVPGLPPAPNQQAKR